MKKLGLALRLAGRVSLLAVAMVIPTALHAQTSDAEADSGEIIVTATKRAQNVQDIPISVSSLSGEDLRSRGLLSIEDIASAVPNLNFGDHVGSTMITVRGVGSTVDSGVTEPTVATYVDGAFLPRATMSNLRAVDLARLEVLRGPQGTIYGRNATGGAINFVSMAPSREFSGGVNIGTGSRSAFNVSGYVSGPIADGILVRLSGGHEEQDGFVRVLPVGKALGNISAVYVRGAVRLEPTSELTVDLSVRYERSIGVNGYQQLLSPTILVPTSIQTTQANRIYADFPFAQKVETLVATGTVNWNVSDGISLRSISSYVDHTSIISIDGDATSANIVNIQALSTPGLQAALPAGTLPRLARVKGFERPSNSFGQEFNLIGDTGPVKWVIGAYYFHENFDINLPVVIFGVAPVIQAVREKTESVALFADATISLTDKLGLNLGARFNHETKDFLSNLSSNTTALGGPSVAFVNVPGSLKSDRLLPKIGLQYKFTDDINAYAQWQRGFKSGGQNLQLLPQYAPEAIDAYEVGLKTKFADRRATFNLAAFYYDYSGLQLTTNIPPATTVVRNADARVYGIEGEFTFQPIANIRLNASGSLLNARFTSFSDFDQARPGPAFNLKGKALPRAPNFTAQLGAEYSIPLGEGFFQKLTLRGDLNHSSSVVLRFFGTPNDTQKAYTVGNLSAILFANEDKSSLRVFVNNVGNTLYLQNVTYIAQLPEAYLGNYSRPREWGVTLSHNF